MTKKEKILYAALRLFANKGFADTSTAELAKAIGVAESTIFYHFGSKEDLLLEVLREVRREVLRHFEEHERVQAYSCGLEKVEGLLGFYLYLSGVMEDAFLLLHRHYPYMLARENEVCREQLEAIYNCFIELFEQAVALGRADGSVADVRQRKVAMVLFTMVDGLARFKTYNLYDAGALFDEMIASVRKILTQPLSPRTDV
ncbi:TetR/AcrR family transcriptional regulator [Desulfocurvus sp.]|jgi:AcrR family transcriptional regulator|uniref:TetR/AcrR family transcriptional regulator n=1 Tax=Desulfocurvus sp. TaxID=2871698 RepID=UPI0025BF567A|nr:TetR/AcrR family transcriptional regulator [Desulfocurvus sp.]MCK9240348.1 TetR/AcrR family transcriptional regulator [Desulfocurvus sp.]